MKTKTKRVKPRAVKASAKAGGTKKNAASDIVLTTLAIGAVGVVGYLGWQYMKKRRGKGTDLDAAISNHSGTITAGGGNTTVPSDSSAAANYPDSSLPSSNPAYSIDPDINEAMNTPIKIGGKKKTKTADSFPLKKGSKGEKVRLLQQALIDKNGAAILPKYGADGSFGTELVTALKKLKLSATVSETLYNVLVGGSGSTTSTTSSSPDKATLAKQIFVATQKRDFNTVLSLLGGIGNSTDYTAVNNVFKMYRLFGGVRKTLVTGLLGVFCAEAQKQQLRLAFAKMGLTYNGSTWSLSGLDGLPIVTTTPARIWTSAYNSITVPARMVLGQQVTRKLDYVLFSNNGRYFLVHNSCIKPL